MIICMRCADLVRVGSGHEYDRAALGYLPGTSRMNFAEEEVNEYGEGPEEEIVHPGLPRP